MTLADLPHDVPEYQVLRSLMERQNRGDPLAEAIFTAAETVVLLANVARAKSGRSGLAHIEALREALASARATVVAAGYALTTDADTDRMSKSPPAVSIPVSC
jgi:hypothetical protein